MSTSEDMKNAMRRTLRENGWHCNDISHVFGALPNTYEAFMHQATIAAMQGILAGNTGRFQWREPNEDSKFSVNIAQSLWDELQRRFESAVSTRDPKGEWTSKSVTDVIDEVLNYHQRKHSAGSDLTRHGCFALYILDLRAENERLKEAKERQLFTYRENKG